MKKSKILSFFVILLIISISGCKKTGEAGYIDYSSQIIVIGENEDSRIVAATTDVAGTLSITNSAIDSDYPPGTNPTSLPDLMIVGTYINGEFSNSFLSSYITANDFLTSKEAIILSKGPPDYPIRYTIIIGNTVDITVKALKILKQYGLDGSYANELNWGFIRVNSIVPHCSDQVQNADEVSVDCGGSCHACSQEELQTTRISPPTARVNTPFAVTINLNLDEGSKQIVAVEETLPSGCTLQGSSINSIYASTPTWLFDDTSFPLPRNPRIDTNFTYNVICTSAGTKTFSGQVSTTHGSIATTGHTSTVIS